MPSGFVLIAIVGWLLVGGGAVTGALWVIGRRPPGERTCPSCGYDLSGMGVGGGAGATVCPECGKEASLRRSRRARLRLRRWMWFALLLLVIGGGVLVFNPWRRDGWATAVPLWAVRPMLPWFESRADPVVTRLSGAFAVGTLQEPTRWERLLIAQRCRTKLVEIAGLVRTPRDQRITPPPGSPSDSESSEIEQSLRMMFAVDPLDAATREFDDLMRHVGADGRLLITDLHGLMRTAEEVGDYDTWWWGMRWMRRIGHFDGAGRRLVISLLKDEKASTRMFALSTVVEAKLMGPRELVQTLTAALDDPDASNRLYVVGWLGKMGIDAAPALERLRTAAKSDPDDWVKSAAGMAVRLIEAYERRKNR